MSYYDYQELKAKVIETRAQDDINALGEWFSHYGSMYWNGEYYDADDFRVYPVYAEIDEDEYDITSYEIR